MKKQALLFAAVALLVLGGGVTFYAVGAETEKEDDDDDEGGVVAAAAVPAPVMATAKSAVPNGTFQSAEVENEDGAKVYEVVVKTPEGAEIELEILANGQLLETSQEMAETALPPAVAKTLKEVLPGGTSEEIEKKSIVVYCIEKEVGGTSYELMIDANGEVVSLEVLQ